MLNTSDNNYSINRYEVIRTDSHGCDLLVPLFTRPKSMIHGTDYSGNNPHEYYVRYAKLKITAIFMTSAGEKTVEKIVDIYQVPRITNPKAVWKEAGSTESFDVLLTTRINGGGNADFTGFPSDGSWTAEIDKTGQYSNFSLEGNGGSYISTSPTMIEGRTGSEVKFRVKFNGAAAACGIITIRYNGGTCIHKIFLRQGFEPMQVTTNGAYWCSYNVYSSTGAFNTNGDKTVDAKLVKSPMSIGSLFRKGNYEQGILIKNNNKWGALVDGPYNFALSNGKYSSWDNISYTSSRYYYYKGTLYSPNYNWQWAKFKAEDGKTYRVPSYNEYQDITNNCDFGFGSLYGNGATETKTRYIEAIGYMDENGSTTSSPYGVRGVIVYNNRNANQIFFSMGKFGQGRRTRFNLQGNTEGVLRYGDVTNLLPNVTTEGSINNQFRPIPYNLGHQPGSVYWIRGIDYRNVTASNGNDTGGWDINYFSLNFSEYTNNCYGDALPIKLVLDR